MNKPMPVRGTKSIIKEQDATIRKQHQAIDELKADKARLLNLLARQLDDMRHHACLTDETLRIMKRVHEEEMGE